MRPLLIGSSTTGCFLDSIHGCQRTLFATGDPEYSYLLPVSTLYTQLLINISTDADIAAVSVTATATDILLK